MEGGGEKEGEYFPKVGGLVFHLVTTVSYRWVSLGAS